MRFALYERKEKMKAKYILNKKEVVVVFGCIFLLMINLGAVGSMSDEHAKRIVCRTNFKSLAVAMMVFANDDEHGQYPNQTRRGGVEHTWHYVTSGWGNPNKDWTDARELTNSASLFLLVREVDADPKSFVCPNSDQKVFEAIPPNTELVEIWDFGSPTYQETGSENCVSYAYQNTFQVHPALPAFPADPTSPAEMALMADRNPYWDEDSDKTSWPTEDNYMGVADLLHTGDIPETEFRWRVMAANSMAHGREGQNVLYNDGHAEFTERPDVGVANDNIYLPYAGSPPYHEEDRRQGGPRDPTFTAGTIRDDRDSYLVNEYEK